MDAIALLKADHHLFRELLERLAKTEAGDDGRRLVFHELKARIIAHETIEEEILYPSLQAFKRAEEIVAHSYEEHHVVDLLLDELTALSFSDDAWGAKAHVLEENLLHHLKDEEAELFPKARRLLDADTLGDLGVLMDERRDEVMASAAVRPGAKAVDPDR